MEASTVGTMLTLVLLWLALLLSGTVLQAAYVEKHNLWVPNPATELGGWFTKDLSGGPFNVPADAVVEVLVANSDPALAFGAGAHFGGVRAEVAVPVHDRRIQLHQADGGGFTYVTMHVQANSSSEIQFYAETDDIVFLLVGYWDGGVAYDEDFASITPATDGWQTQALSGVAAGEVAEIAMTNLSNDTSDDANTRGRWAGARKTGSAVERRLLLDNAASWSIFIKSGGGENAATLFVEADGSSEVELYADNSVDPDITFYVLGSFTTPPGTFVELAETDWFIGEGPPPVGNTGVGSPTLVGAWEAKDLSAWVPSGAVAEILVGHSADAAQPEMGVRSTLFAGDRVVQLHDAGLGGGACCDIDGQFARMHVPVDGSGAIQWKSDVGLDADDHFLLSGFWVGPVVVVNSTGGSGDNNPGDHACDTGGLVGPDPECTLRAAIEEANASAIVDTIHFEIPAPLVGGAHTITPGAGGLPPTTNPVVIDGTTDSDFGSTPIIEIDGSTAGGVGLEVQGGGSVVRGLVVNRFVTGIKLTIGGGNTVVGNYLGTDVTGAVGLVGNIDEGILIDQSAGNIIGGAAAADRNVISGNRLRGVNVDDWTDGVPVTSAGTQVLGNYIGVDRTGTAMVPYDSGPSYQQIGVYIVDSSGTLVGTPAAGNVISGNAWYGVYLWAPDGSGNKLQNNIVGLDQAASGAVPNGWESATRSAIYLSSAPANLVGGAGPGEGNIIASNAHTGVLVQGAAAIDNAILGNSIYDNVDLGIDLDVLGVNPNDGGDGDPGPNDRQNFPVITSAVEQGGLVAVGFDLDTLAGDYRIEFFDNSTTDREGESYADFYNVIGHPGGLASYSTTIPGSIGSIITATATEEIAVPFGSTSEFSAVFSSISGPTITLPSGALNYTEGDPPTPLDAAATVSDPDSLDFAGGTLTITIAINATGNDRLAINDEGPGAGKISLSGINDVTYDDGVGGPQIIGSYAGGTGATPLVVSLVAPANVVSTRALLRNITYENVVLLPATTPRTVSVQLTDGDGGTSNLASKFIDYSGLNTLLPHEYFVPIPDEQARAWAVAVDDNTFPPSDDLRAVVSITVTLDGNRIVYDHWEDGLETNPSNPTQATTEIWGDGRAATGCPPTVNRLPLACTNANDLFDAGDILALENDVPANPRGNAIRFDGGDLIASDELLAVTRAGWPINVGTCPGPTCYSGVVLAGAVETYVTSEWGTSFIAPVGTDAPGQMFEYAAFSVMAGADGTMVSVDVDNDGTLEFNQTLARGESLLAPNVEIGGTVQASKKVQVDLLTGDIGSTYEARWFALASVGRWSSEYYTPVGETDPSAPVKVFFYNPADHGIDVDYETLSTSGTVTVPAGGMSEYTMPANSGGRFSTQPGPVGWTLRDEFDTRVWDGTNGTNDWSASPWVEKDFSGVGPTGGDIQIKENSANCYPVSDGQNCLEFKVKEVGDYLYREADLSGCSEATLSYDYNNLLEGSDRIELQVATAGGTPPFVTVLTEFNSGNAGTGSESVELQDFVSTLSVTTAVAFYTVNADRNKNLYIDNVQITCDASEAPPFYALSSIDDSTTYDWGFSLISLDYLSTAAVVGWAPGSSDLTENGSPIWVTAEADTTLYVDFNGDGTSDTSYALNRLAMLRVRDTLANDNDQTGIRLYTVDGTRIAAAWGQEPGVASTGSPAIDLGTTVLPFINPALVKKAVLHIDVAGNGLVDPGDTLLYSLTVKNISTAALIDPTIVDNPDANVTYVAGSAEVYGAPFPDDSLPATAFPFDEAGATLPTILPGETVVATYQMQVDDPLPAGVTQVLNDAVVTASDGTTSAATDNAVAIPSLTIDKLSNVAGDAVPGQVITYTITVTNPSSVPQSGVSVQDALPAGTTYVAQSTVATGPGPVTKDNVPAGANADLSDGSPPDLVLVADAFTLGAGETLTVTYQVQVNNPLDRGVSRIVNTATADGSDLMAPVSDTVVDPAREGGRIGDLVWLDADGDGIYDIGEPGLPNVTLDLLDGTCTPGSNCRTTVTSSNGLYLFDRLAPGNYQVQVQETTLPGGVGDLVAAPGTSNPAPSPALVVTAAERYSGVDFGYRQAATKMVVGDFVWSDADNDGVQDPGEVGIAGVTIDLLDAGTGAVVDTTATGADGKYLFTVAFAGEYRVEVTDTGGVLGSYALTVGAQSATNPSAPITVAEGGACLEADFGYFDASTFSVSEAVWLDEDADGAFNLDEDGLEGVTVVLVDDTNGDGVWNAGEPIVASVTSDASGDFSFSGLEAGDYVLAVEDAASVLAGMEGTTPSGQAFSLAFSVGPDRDAKSFGYTLPGAVGSRVWSDANGDGTQDPGEPGLADVTVALWRDDGDGAFDSTVDTLIGSTTTDSAGTYLFSGLAAGVYFASVDDGQSALTGASPTTTDEQTGGNAAGTQIEAVLGSIDAGFLTADFGYQNASLAEISGSVFEDVDADGVEEAGETGFAGVTLVLVPLFAVIDGFIDVDGSGVIDSADDGSIEGIAIINGRVDADGDGNATVPDGDDDVIVNGVTIIDGLVDLDGDGVAGEVNGDDSGTLDGRTTATTATDANGDYVFSDVPGSVAAPRSYRIAVTDTAGILVDATLTSGLDQIEAQVSGTDLSGIDFGYRFASSTAALGDLIWLDADRDGMAEPVESGITGVTVDLYSAGADAAVGGGDDVLLDSAVTDGEGGYQFTGLEPGVYYVDVTDTGSVLAGLALTAGSTDPSAVVALSEGETSEAADFGYGAAANSLVGDTIWHDEDGDGYRDPGEVGIAGVTVNLWDPGADGALDGTNDTLLGTTATDAFGRFLFFGVLPGDVWVVVDTGTLPAGYSATPTNGAASSKHTVVTGADMLFADFGFDGATTGSIGDTVFFDANGDGTQLGADEVGLEGVTVDLWRDPDGTFMNGDEMLVATTTTGIGGVFDFVGLPAADYDVVVSDTHGVVSELNATLAPAAAITITVAGEDVDTADFGYAPSGGTGAIGDIVWHDVDGDGVHEPLGADGTAYTTDDEWGIGRVTLELWLDVNGNGTVEAGTDNLVRTTETDENGQYEFLSVPYGDYVVRLTDTNCVLDTGCDGTIHGDEWNQTSPAPSPSEIAAVTLSAGTPSDFSSDFGYQAADPHTISGTAFFDANNNGVLDPLENGVSDVRIYLYRDLDGDEELDPTDARMGATDSLGAFSFVDLPDGDYLLVADTSGSFVDGMTQTTQQGTGGIQPVSIMGGNETDQDFGFWVQTTAVLVSSFGAEIGGGGVVVRWETASEAGAMGFYLYRWDESLENYALVNEQLLPAAVGSPQGGVYELVDEGARPGEALRYALVEIETGGAERSYGPFDVTVTGRSAFEGERRVRGRARPEAVSRQIAERRAEAQSRSGMRSEATADEPSGGMSFSARSGSRSVEATKSTARKPGRGRPGSGRPGRQRASRLDLEVMTSGLYQVTAGEIANLTGVSSGKILSALSAGKLRLSVGGEQVAWKQVGDSLVFYGEAMNSPYTATNVYRLELGTGETMITGWGGTPPAGATTVSSASADFENNVFAMTVTESADADFYYWAYLSAGDPTWGSFQTTFQVTDPEPGEGTLEVRFQSATSTPAPNEHQVRASLNGSDLGTAIWDGMAAHTGIFTVPSGVVLPGNNTLDLTAELAAGVPYSVVLADGFKLDSPRLHRTVADRVLVTTEAWGPVSVEGLSTADVLVADVTDAKHPIWLDGVTITPDGAGFRATFEAADAGRTYAIETTSAVASPAIVGRVPSNLRQSAGADYVVIAPETLLTGAQSLADYRTSMGHSTMVIELDEIYGEFSHGVPTPEAIHDFLAYAWNEWPVAPRFAVLAGDGTFDYQDHQGLGDNLVPPRLVATPQGMFASDVMLGDVAGGDGIPEVAVGRIPATTDLELAAYVSKLSAHESAGLGTGVERLTMLADNADSAGNFPLDSDSLLVSVPGAVVSERIYLSEMALGTARSATFGAFATGTDWVNYLGHGGIDRFANEGMLLATDAPALAVGDRLPVVSSLTCSAGRFEVPGWQSLAEALVLEPNGGAAAVWAPAGQSYHFEAMALNEALFAAIFSGSSETVGELMLETLTNHQPTPGFEYLPAVYNLIGDPAYRVR